MRLARTITSSRPGSRPAAFAASRIRAVIASTGSPTGFQPSVCLPIRSRLAGT
jgi:hypothetical protein